MKIFRKLFYFLSIAFALSVSAQQTKSLPQAKSIVLKQTNENGIYKIGDKINLTYYLKDAKTDSIIVKIKKK